MTARLAADGICKRYGMLRVLDGASLRVAAGEIVAIRGASGTGKSTLLHILGLLDRADAGSVRIDGVEVANLSERQRARWRARRIGFVFQSFHLLADFSIRENVLMSARTAGMPLAEARARADALLARVGLGGRDGRIDVLSGGERQRVALCRALLPRPAVLLADEPTGNLDPATARTVLDELVDLARREASAVVIVTHDQAVAARADRTWLLADGKLHAAPAEP
ncbi:MAG: ABC transporter ATP-binding protein [Planctomycetota bacterium]|nr:ABC transporter ATP-binding protein [Planctomycetota bacterium]MDW8372110.1 ABC transporter ATP-binding protein [Planctomycetota bacterium]